MLTLSWRTIKDKKWVILTYCLIGFLILWMYASIYPSMKGSSQEISELIKNLPESLNKAFGLDPKAFTTFEGLIAGKNFSLIWPILLIGLLVSLASSFLSGEVENGTVEFLLSQPISRMKIFLVKSTAGIFSLITFIIFSILLILPLTKIYNISIISKNFLNLSLVGFFFGLAILGLSIFFSSLFSERSRVAFWVSGILLFMYVINIVALLKENLDKIKYFSFFYYFNYSEILIDNKLNYLSFWVFWAVFVIGIILGLLCFQKRDTI